MNHFDLINEAEFEEWDSKRQYAEHTETEYPPLPIAIWKCKACGSTDCITNIGKQENADSHMLCNNCHTTEAI